MKETQLVHDRLTDHQHHNSSSSLGRIWKAKWAVGGPRAVVCTSSPPAPSPPSPLCGWMLLLTAVLLAPQSASSPRLLPALRRPAHRLHRLLDPQCEHRHRTPTHLQHFQHAVQRPRRYVWIVYLLLLICGTRRAAIWGVYYYFVSNCVTLCRRTQ